MGTMKVFYVPKLKCAECGEEIPTRLVDKRHNDESGVLVADHPENHCSDSGKTEPVHTGPQELNPVTMVVTNFLSSRY